MKNARNELAKYILENDSPIEILRAVVSFVRVSSIPYGQRIADAVDITIKQEIESMKQEQFITPGGVLNMMKPRGSK